PLVPEPTHPCPSSVHGLGAFQAPGYLGEPLDVRVVRLNPAIGVAAVPSFEGPPRQLHVLLRNTPSPALQDWRFHPSRVTTDRSSWPLLRHHRRSIPQARGDNGCAFHSLRLLEYSKGPILRSGIALGVDAAQRQSYDGAVCGNRLGRTNALGRPL